MLKTTDAAYLRLLEEKVFLEQKVDKLDQFVLKARKGELEEAVTITLSEIQLLEEQLHYMRGYLRTLNTRIANVKR